MGGKQPREHPLVDTPATVAACRADREAAHGQGAATEQLGQARAHGSEQATTR